MLAELLWSDAPAGEIAGIRPVELGPLDESRTGEVNNFGQERAICRHFPMGGRLDPVASKTTFSVGNSEKVR